MIPNHLIDKAARAARENDRIGKWAGLEWEDLDQYTQDSYLNNARAALEATAAEIWDDGEEAGLDNALWKPGYEHCHVKNPYRASEDA